MSEKSHKYYREITKQALTVLLEVIDGTTTQDGEHAGLSDCYLDVKRVFDRLEPYERTALLGVYRDGLTHKDAVTRAGVTVERADAFIAALEDRLGRIIFRLLTE